MNIDRLIQIGRDHPREHRPQHYRELEELGELEGHLAQAARDTHRDLGALVDAGYSPDEAWQMVRERYLILPGEENDSEEPHPNAGLFGTLREIQELRMQIEDEIAELPRKTDSKE